MVDLPLVNFGWITDYKGLVFKNQLIKIFIKGFS
tara:strand:+ start:280 stop:381 length:102 start_codon:yes stop_codon:yes gene_type:complete